MRGKKQKQPTVLAFDQLRERVEKAVNTIYRKEYYLTEHGLAEWTLSAQFHYWVRKYCEKSLKGLDFDSEYNHMHFVSKNDPAVDSAKKYICSDKGKSLVRPDFIIHKRGNPEHNYLWVEMKRRGGKDWKDDLKRVKAVTKEQFSDGVTEYVSGYSFGLGVLFHKHNAICIWCRGGDFLLGRKVLEKKNALSWHDCKEDGRIL